MFPWSKVSFVFCMIHIFSKPWKTMKEHNRSKLWPVMVRQQISPLINQPFTHTTSTTSSGFSTIGKTISRHTTPFHSSERWFCSDVMEKSQPIKWFYVALCQKTKTIRGFAPPVRVGSGAKRPAKNKNNKPSLQSERTWLGQCCISGTNWFGRV